MARVILSRPDRLGDVIITSSLLPVLRAAWPRAELYWLVAPAYQSLFQDHPLLAGLISPDSALEKFRPLRATSIIHFQPNAAVAAAARQAGIREQIGYRQGWWSAPLTEAYQDDRPLGWKHEAEYSLDLAGLHQEIPDRIPRLQPSLHLPKDSLDLVFRHLPTGCHLNQCFVLNPSAYSDYLRWPWERFLEVCRWMNREHDLQPILVSGEAEDSSIRQLDAALRAEGLPFVNLAGQLTLVELASLLRHVRLHLARNTGTSHLAAAMGCPQVEIFIRATGRYSVQRWKALSPLSRQVVPRITQELAESNPDFWSRCAAAIAVEQVCATLSEVLLSPAAQRSTA